MCDSTGILKRITLPLCNSKLRTPDNRPYPCMHIIIRSFSLSLILLIVSVVAPKTSQAAFSFVPNDYYTSNYSSRVITQYDPSANIVGSFTVPSSYGSELRGITFGPDNLLYTVIETTTGFSVLALNSSGVPQQTYSGTAFVGGDISTGRSTIVGQYLYVAAHDSLTRFLLGNPSSGTVIYSIPNQSVCDTTLLPNGNLFVASSHLIQEITPNGSVVRTLPLLGSDGLTLNDITGIEYNSATNDLFVTELGHTDASFQLMRFDATTGALEKNTFFIYGNDMFLTTSGALLVGSRTQVPAFYDQDLNPLGTLHGSQQMFVTQFVPEPATVVLFLVGAVIAAFGPRRV